MGSKFTNKSIWVLGVLLILGFLHTLPLWDTHENLAAGYGDPLSHATIGQWYCGHVLTGNFHSDQFLAPFGADMSGTYDSAFPYALTCPFVSAGTIFQFHLFTLFQIWLILFSSWLVARKFIQNPIRQLAYVLFVWWCGFYISRSHQHVTLLSTIWGMQFVFYAVVNLNPRSLRNVLGSSVLLGLSYVGTFHNIPALFLITLVLVAYKFYQLRGEIFHRDSLRNLGIGLLVTGAVFAAFWWPMIAYNLKNGAVTVDQDRRLYNLDLLSAFIPADNNIVFDWWPSLTKLPLERQNTFDPLILLLVTVSLFSKKFWKNPFKVLLLAVAAIYFVLALGPELRINNDVSVYLDFNAELFHYFPMRITRTPGRLAVITNLCCILLAFLFVEGFENDRLKKYFSFFLVAWIFILGPMMNQMWFFPTLKYNDILNNNALAKIKSMPEETIVVQIPSAWAQDPSENFQQIFHGKRISSGYLAYTNYNRTVIENFLNEPFLGKLGCDGEPTAFQETPFLVNADQLHQYLKEHHYQAMIVNKSILLYNPGCHNLAVWLQGLIKQPWVKVLEENNLFLMLEVW